MDIPFHRKLKQVFFFYSGRLISICSYSFWRRSNYFSAVEGLQFLTRAELFFLIYSFRAVRFVTSALIKTDKFFNHFGRSDAWNSTHHGRYVFQTRFFS